MGFPPTGHMGVMHERSRGPRSGREGPSVWACPWRPVRVASARVSALGAEGAAVRSQSPEDVALYRKVWDALNASAVYGRHAHRLIVRARSSLDLA